MNKKLLALVILLGLSVAFFAYRSNTSQIVRSKIVQGMSPSEVSVVLRSGVIEPYACLWKNIDKQKATRNCQVPNKNFLTQDSLSGLRVMVVFKGIGIDHHFEIIFDETKRVKKVTAITVR